MIVFAATTAVAMYVILDIECPQRDLIKMDTADHVLLELRESMK